MESFEEKQDIKLIHTVILYTGLWMRKNLSTCNYGRKLNGIEAGYLMRTNEAAVYNRQMAGQAFSGFFSNEYQQRTWRFRVLYRSID